MRLTMLAAAIAAVTLAACDSGREQTATARAPAAAPTRAPEPAAPPAPSASEAAAARAAAFADEASFADACATEGQIDASVCACVGQKTVETLGAGGLFRWVYEGYVNRDGMAQMRSRKWFADNNIDSAGQQKFADTIGTCYSLQ